MTPEQELAELRAQLDAIQQNIEQSVEAEAATYQRYKTTGFSPYAVGYALGRHTTYDDVASMIKAIRNTKQSVDAGAG